VDLSALLSNLSPEVLDLWKQPISTTPLSPSRPARKLQQQRRLPDDIVQQLVFRYQGGASVVQLAREFGINRETALEHLKRAGIARRPHVRKLTDQLVAEAGRLYATGLSLKNVAARFDVSETTIRNEFTRAGIQVRPRRGWND
jgi:transposase-like protein